MSKQTATTQYRCREPINHHGDDYAVGDDIELTDKQAQQLLDVSAIELPTADEPAKPAAKAAAKK